MFRMRWAGSLGALALLVGSLAWSLPVSPARAAEAPRSASVSMKEFAFMPVTITVRQGGTVTWTYDESATDPVPNCETVALQPPSPVTCPGHSTTAIDKGSDGKALWDSGVHRADGFPYTVTFPKPGTYHYICVVHGGAGKNNPVTNMEGDVVVEAATQPVQSATPAPASASVAGATASRDTLAATGASRPWAVLAVGLLAAGLGGRRVRRRLA